MYPGAVEVCDGIDNDCDGDVDIDAAAPPTWYADSDGDTWGDPTAPALGCEPPDGHVADLTDCDDTDAAVHPGAEEVCDGIDNDCDGLADIGAVDAPTWYEDADSDGYGDPTSVVQACEQPDGYVDNPADCADDDPSVRPGMVDDCDAVDDDCDGSIDEDVKAGWKLVTVDTFAGWIYEIDNTTAAMTPIAPVADLYINSVDVWEGGQPIAHSSLDYQLFEIDICTGETQLIGNTGVGDMGGISFRSGYRLYGLDFDADTLVELDPWTGAGTPIGSLGFNLGPDGLAYDCSTDTLYGADAYSGNIFTIDPMTGAATGFLGTTVPFVYVGLEFDHATGTLFASTGYALYQIDPLTGATTFIGDLGGVRINDLAFHPPCP